MTSTTAASAPADAAPAWDTAVFAATVALMVWLPLPLASARPWAAALLALAVWGLLAVWLGAALATGHTGHGQRLGVRRGAPWLLLLVACAALPALQLAAPQLGLPGLATRDAFLTRQFLLAALGYTGLGLLVLLVAGTQARVTALLAAVVAATFLQALLAVGLHAGRGQYLYLFAEFQQGGRATGTFVNSDHLAGYMELGLSAGLGLLLALMGVKGERRSADARGRAAAVLAFVLSRVMLLRLALVVLVVVLVMTHSRMGNGAFFISLLLVGLLVAVVSRQLRKPALWLVASMAIVDVIVIGQWVGLDRVVERLQGTVVSTREDALRARMDEDEATALLGAATTPQHREESLQDRLQMPFAALQLADQRPWLGHGGGAFRVAAAPEKPGDLALSRFYWDYAHNDYVQTAVETGYPGLALWLLIGIATAWRAARLLPDRQPAAARGVGVAGLMALSCLGLHSLVDFNLQIPANAATLVLLLALVWATPLAPAAPPRRSRSTRAATAPG